MEVLGIYKATGIVIGLVIQLSLMALGFRIYFKGRHFWGTYTFVAAIGGIIVSIFFLMMHWVAINSTILVYYKSAFWISSVLTSVLLCFSIGIYLYQNYIQKGIIRESVNLDYVLDQVDCLIFVFDSTGNKVNAFGRLDGLDLNQASFNNWQSFEVWKSQCFNHELDLKGALILTYGSTYLLVESVFLENRNGNRVGRIVTLSDVTREQTLNYEIEKANFELNKANAAFYSSIDKEIQLKKEAEKKKIIAEINALLLDEIGTIIDQMTLVIEDADLTLDAGKKAVQEMVLRTEGLYKKMRETLKQLSPEEGENI